MILMVLVAFVSQAQPTYYKHVAPIIIDNCVFCHRDGEVAPFPLTTYKEVSAKARLIQFVTQTGYMPPWLADPAYRHYENERLLTATEIKVIKDWIKGGKLAGNKADMPALPKYSKNSYIARKPDMVVRMKNAFPIPGNNKETFAAIRLPVEFDTEKNIECIEFVAGNRRLVHHMNVEIFDGSKLQDLHRGEEHLVLTGAREENVYQFMNVINPDGRLADRIYYGGWVPGMTAQIFSRNIGIRLPRKSVILINSMHYDQSPINDIDNSYFNIYFKEEPVTRPVQFAAIGSGEENTPIVPELVLDPGKVQSFKTSSKLNEDVSLMYVSAHMHMLGKKFVAYAVTPRRDTIPLIRINDWDFNWQEFYGFNPMIKIPKGSTVYAEGTYDNTINNPFNPFNPPQQIYSQGNMETTNEMLNVILLYLPYRPGDEKTPLR
jgi:hypothetical protein